MGSEMFTCGRYRNKTFEEIAKNEPEFCQSVLKTAVCNKYYPENFKKYLLSLNQNLINESSVTSFVRKWDEAMMNEFHQIIGDIAVDVNRIHPKSRVFPNGNIGVFYKYFIKKCIFNLQNKDAVNYSVEKFASIFPFKVSRKVAPVTVPVLKLFDDDFHAAVRKFLLEHFEENRVTPIDDLIELFLRNIYCFRQKYFDENTETKLIDVVKRVKMTERASIFGSRAVRSDTVPYVNEYLKQFPRPNADGVDRYRKFRNTFNRLRLTFGEEKIGEQQKSRIQMLPEITCLEVLSLLNPDFYSEHNAMYRTLFTKYLFFFTYAIDNENGNPVFFIDDPLFECLKAYAIFARSRDPPENLQFPLWSVSLIHRRTQESNMESKDGCHVDEESLLRTRQYIENFPDVQSMVIDFVLPTELLILGIGMFTKNAILTIHYSSRERNRISDFYKSIIRGVICPEEVEKCVIYNAFTGCETSVSVPHAKKTEILDFVRKYNHYDASQALPEERIFTSGFERFFEKETVAWETKPSLTLDEMTLDETAGQ